jgi:hypothetical protein
MTPCPHSFVEREEAATVDGRCPLCPPFDVDKVAEEIANDVSGILRAKYMTRAVKMRIAAIINRAINGG